jgi:hypothetical protein
MNEDDGQAQDDAPGQADVDEPKRSRGRPAIGKASQIRLSESEKALANDLGGGKLAEGVRHALHLVQLIGLEGTRRMLGLAEASAASGGASTNPAGPESSAGAESTEG